jgi:hypothetical protein
MLFQRTKWFAVLLLGGYVVLTSDVPASAAPPTVDPCKVLATAEIEHTIGKLKGTPKADKEGEVAWCDYQFANGKDAMEVWVFPADGLDRAKKKAKNQTAIRGLGDEAFLTRGMFGLDYVDLYIKKGSTTVKLSLKETTGDEDKLKTLGQKALGRF